MSLDEQILRALRSAATRTASGAEMAQELGVSRAAVWARIVELRRLGYEIEASPHHGYRLLSVPDVLHADDLKSRLPAQRQLGQTIHVFQETTSTNDVVEKLARDGLPEGAVVLAETQTRGRGRLGRRWISTPAKGLWLSILLRPPLRPSAATQITVASAAALARALARVGHCRPEIKWPNDLLLEGRKVAGILTELRAELDRIQYVILGLGVNVHQTASDFPAELRSQAISLRQATGQAVSRAELVVAILTEFEQAYWRTVNGQFAAVAEEWEQTCSTLGQRITIRLGDRLVSGRAEAIDEEGALLLRTDYGRLERITGGDVTLEK